MTPWLVLLLFWEGTSLCAQSRLSVTTPQHYAVSSLSPSKGLSSLRVYSLLEDPSGAMWIGTKTGVDRYNGRSIRNYPLSEGVAYSDISDRAVKLGRADTLGLYAYDNKGKLYRYDLVHDTFRLELRLQNILGDEVLSETMWLSPRGEHYWGLARGLYYLPSGGSTSGEWLLRDVYVQHIVPSSQGLFIGTRQGVYHLPIGSRRPRKLLDKVSALSLYNDAEQGVLWVGTFGGKLLRYDLRSHRLSPKQPQGVPQGSIRSIRPLDQSSLLLGIDGQGIYALHREEAVAHPFLRAESSTDSQLQSNGIYDIAVDHEGNIWVGSYSGGVDLAIPQELYIDRYKHELQSRQSLINDKVNAILELEDGRIAYGTEQGLSIYSPAGQSWQHLLEGAVILSLSRDALGRLLIGTYGRGVYELSPGAGPRPLYSVAEGSLRSDYVYSLHHDRDGALWIGCLDGDLVRLGSGQPIYYPIQQVQQICATPEGGVAVATSNGFYIIASGGQEHSWHFHSEALKGGDYNTYIQALLFVGTDEVLLATDGGGMYRYNIKTRQVLRQYTRLDGLPSNTIQAMCYDSESSVLLSTDRGLARLEFESGELSNLNHIAGLDGEFRRTSLVTLGDGRIALGGNTGAVILRPKDVKALSYQTKLHLVRLQLSGSKVETSWQERLRQGLEHRSIKLPHDRNSLQLTIEAINYRYQHDIAYQHRLEGLESAWSLPSHDEVITYSQLPPGGYTLHIRAISLHDGRTLDEEQLRLYIAAPLWRTWWAYLIYTLTLMLALYIAWRMYITRLERQAFDEKIKFFVHTAHDIRTPLSLILAPLSELAEREQDLSDKGRRYLSIARHNVDRLLSMVTQLLDFQRLERQEVEMYVEELDFVAFLEAKAIAFAPLAEAQEISLHLDLPAKPVPLYLDRTMAASIIDNLVSNAIKYTPPGGLIELRLEQTSEDYVSLYVSDTGIGIPEAAQRNIFRSYYRSDNAINAQIVGSGIGLVLTRRFVERHGGKLSLRSVEGEGTTFVLRLRRGAEHLREHLQQRYYPHSSEQTQPQSLVLLGEDIETTEAGSRETLLFVDDNEELRHYVRLSLSEYYHVVDVPSAEQALLYLEHAVCDIIVSDVMMEGMSGVELCHELKGRDATAWIPIILLTAKSGRDFALEGLAVGAEDYVSKPFDPQLLRAKIDTLLTNRRLLRQYYLRQSLEAAAKRPESATSEEPKSDTAGSTEALAELSNLSAADQAFVEKATNLVLAHISKEDFSIDELCRLMAMSRTLFYGRLRGLTGQAPQEFIRLIRLERAASLLREGYTVLEASEQTGFVNPKYFSTLFKKQYGVSPSKYH